MNHASLRRFWIEFAPDPGSLATTRFGVTAIDLADALALIERWRGGVTPHSMRPFGAPVNVVEDVDVSTLDAGHVLPNMLPPHWRGVWYPATSIA